MGFPGPIRTVEIPQFKKVVYDSFGHEIMVIFRWLGWRLAGFNPRYGRMSPGPRKCWDQRFAEIDGANHEIKRCWSYPPGGSSSESSLSNSAGGAYEVCSEPRIEFGPKCHSIRHVPRGNTVFSPPAFGCCRRWLRCWNILELDFYICFKGFTGPNPLSPRASSWSPTLTREIWWSKLWWRVSYLHHFKWDGHLLVTLPIHWSVIFINGPIVKCVFLGWNNPMCNAAP